MERSAVTQAAYTGGAPGQFAYHCTGGWFCTNRRRYGLFGRWCEKCVQLGSKTKLTRRKENWNHLKRWPWSRLLGNVVLCDRRELPALSCRERAVYPEFTRDFFHRTVCPELYCAQWSSLLFRWTAGHVPLNCRGLNLFLTMWEDPCLSSDWCGTWKPSSCFNMLLVCFVYIYFELFIFLWRSAAH